MTTLDDLLARHPLPWRVDNPSQTEYTVHRLMYLVVDANGVTVAQHLDEPTAKAIAAIPDREALIGEMAAALEETTQCAEALAALALSPDAPARRDARAGRAALARYEAHGEGVKA